MFGNVDGLCNEQTPLAPASPYGVSKMAAHRLVQIYRERGLFVVGGILFNHESPRRGPEMVTRKITRAASGWARGDKKKLQLGNLQARRDWGFAGDYVKAMHAMLQQSVATDYVVGTGESHSVAEFVGQVLAELHALTDDGNFAGPIERYVEVNPRLVRTNEIHDLRADARLIRKELGWETKVDFPSLVRMMLQSDLVSAGELSPSLMVAS
jgi:GDPmannose 4,6-dehydratase